jgi:hypothetical protein
MASTGTLCQAPTPSRPSFGGQSVQQSLLNLHQLEQPGRATPREVNFMGI